MKWDLQVTHKTSNKIKTKKNKKYKNNTIREHTLCAGVPACGRDMYIVYR